MNKAVDGELDGASQKVAKIMEGREATTARF